MNETRNEEGLIRVPPHSEDAEQAVLGSMFLDREAVSLAMETIDETYFYKTSHREIFLAISDLFQKNKEVDLLTITEILKSRGVFEEIGGAYYLGEIAKSTPSSANVEQHLDIVKSKALTRMLIKECETIITDAFNQEKSIENLLDDSEKTIFEISEKRLKKGYAILKPIIDRTIKRIDDLYSSDRSGITGVRMGFKKLDQLTAGLQPSDLVILAGRPSMGKTAFALNIARNAAVDAGVPVGIFSLEMSADALVMRLVCTEAEVDQMKARTGMISKKEMRKITLNVDTLHNAPIFIDDSPSLNVMELRAKARRLKAEQNIQLLIIDYLQLMEGKGENRQQEITHISRAIKGVAKELDIPVMALSQLSRAVESRDKTKRPQLSDLRESGAIEQDADVVMFVYRPEYYDIEEFDDTNASTKNICEIIIGKQRNGPTGFSRLTFKKEFGRFGDSPDVLHGGAVPKSEF